MARRDLASLLPELSLRRRVTVLVLLASVLVLGTVATLFIPLELIPRGFSEPFLGVYAPWRDAPPEEVLEKVLRPLEEELATVGGLSGMNSSANPGYARLFLRFKQGTDMDVAYREVRDRIERAKVRLPEDVPRVFIRKHDDSGIPVAVYGLTVGPEVTNSYDLIHDEVVVALQRLDGVAAVEVQGQLEKEILIELDRERTEAAGLNIYQLAQDLGGDNFALASGHVEAAGRKLLLRSVARYEDVEELRRRPVAPGVRLADIATVRYDEPEKLYRVRAMSLPAVAVQVYKEGDANTLQVAREVEAEVERLRRNPRLADVGIETLFNQRQIILESLDTLIDAGKVGGLFAVVVLFFFLRRVRMTLIITLSIPLSLLVALTVMYFAGETLNIISLLGLMISVGLLVDNSVVVAENVFRLHREGRSRREACIEGAREIALAITMATLTTVIVFLPASLVEGQGQFFLMRLAMPVCISLLASLLVALVLIPLALYATLPRNGGSGRTSAFRRLHQRLNDRLRAVYDATMGRLNDLYGGLLGRALARRLDLVLLLLVVLAVTGWAFGERVEVVEVQEDEQRGFYMEVELPQNTTLAEAEQFFLTVEKVVEAKRDEYQLAGWFVFHRATFGEIQGWFAPERKGGPTPREITAELLETLPEKPGVRYYTGQESEEEREEKGVFRLTLYSDDLPELERTAAALGDRLLSVPGVLGLRKNADRPTEELALVVERDRAQRLGVSPEVVAAVVGYALRGQSLPRYSRDGKEVPVLVRFQEEDRETLQQLEDFAVPTMTGGVVPLRAVTDVRFLPAPREISRRDRRTARELAFDLVEGEEEATRERLQAAVTGFALPEGVTSGELRRQGMGEDAKGLLFAVGLSIVFIYLLMAFLFESFVLPLSIVLTIPLAFLGVAWGHIAAGLDLDFLGMVGLVLLIGVVVNNGIVLIDYVNRLRHAGQPRAEALLLAAHRRFRPIMMTALTTMFGMVPMLLSSATSIGMSYTSFAIS
ncbi:MAG TPA: efflux RND transporter permease subunit, partial [Thermoanaerobaculia bacterium]|nr:efflux RND transporter permease subunit [Thermoanaerobaculia bacterium]